MLNHQEKINATKRKQKLQRISKYNDTPKHCAGCNTKLEYECRHNKFCSHKCSATQSNHIREFNPSKDTRTKIALCSKCNQKIEVNIRSSIKNIKCNDCKILVKTCKNCGEKFKTKNKKVNSCSKSCSSQLTWKGIRENIDEYKKLKSEMLKEQYKNGRKVYGGNNHVPWYDYKRHDNIQLKVQGTYELRTCKILDEWLMQGKIKNWEYTNDRYEYIGEDNEPHTYLIDFKVYNHDNTFYYVEVKGRIKTIDNIKWSSVKERGYKIEIWDLDIIERYE